MAYAWFDPLSVTQNRQHLGYEYTARGIFLILIGPGMVKVCFLEPIQNEVALLSCTSIYKVRFGQFGRQRILILGRHHLRMVVTDNLRGHSGS
jgi:hypothetical protein